jgi:hypothetical protein
MLRAPPLLSFKKFLGPARGLRAWELPRHDYSDKMVVNGEWKSHFLIADPAISL